MSSSDKATEGTSAFMEYSINDPKCDAPLEDRLRKEPKECVIDQVEKTFIATSTSEEEKEKEGDVVNNPSETHSLLAYLIIPASFFIWFNSWGAINAYGVFQTHYQISLLSQYSPSTIAWNGSVQNFLLLFVGFLSGPLYDAGYASYLVCGGAALTVLGKMMLSLAQEGEYYQVFLAQAICVGLGWGLMFTPAASMPGRFWKGKQLGVAAGVAGAGASVGGVVYSLGFSQLLQSSAGFPWATRFLGFLALITLSPSCIIIALGCQKHPSPSIRRRRNLIDKTTFKDLPFIIYLIGGIFTMAGMQAPYYYTTLYAIDLDITSSRTAFYIITAINAGSFFGRLFPPFLTPRLGIFNTLILFYFATISICFSFISAQSSSSSSCGSIFALATLYGFFSGAVVTLGPITILQMTSDPRLWSTRMGMAFAIPSFGVLVGCPIFGHILKVTHSYTYVWVMSALCMTIGAMSLIVCRIAQSGWVFFKRV